MPLLNRFWSNQQNIILVETTSSDQLRTVDKTCEKLFVSNGCVKFFSKIMNTIVKHSLTTQCDWY